MPYYDRYQQLARAISAYERFYYAHNIEFIVADDGSTDPLIDLETFLDFTIVNLPGPKPPKNPCVPINAAVALAQSDVIVITNPEIIHETAVFDQMLDRLKNKNDYVIAACQNQKTGRWQCRSTVEHEHPLPPGAGFHFCVMLHKDLFYAADGFDEDYRDGQGYDDNDWCWRLYEAGANFIMCDDIVVQHPPSRTLWPKGGLERNRKLLQRKWGHLWNQS
jgi:GT2 family glycosyltransferase